MSNYDMKKYWNNLYKQRGQLNELLDNEGLLTVCHPDKPLYYNKLFDFFEKKAFSETIQKCGLLLNKVVLDIGSGTGRWVKKFVALGATVHGIDIVEEAISKLKRKNLPGTSFQVMSADKLKFPDNYFDVVNSIVVLLHLPYEKQEKAIAEICRVTKNGGKILLIESTFMKNYPEHVFPNTPQRWISLFQKHGCKLIIYKGQEYFPLLRLFDCLYKTIKKITEKDAKDRSTIDLSYNTQKKAGIVKTLLKKVFSLSERITVYLSYPIEYVCPYIFPSSFSRHGIFLFEVIK